MLPVENSEWKCLYNEGELTNVEIPPPEIEVLSLELEEDFEGESMNIIMKLHRKSLEYLFGKYAIGEKAAAKRRLL
jgi:hypothetical protein